MKIKPYSIVLLALVSMTGCRSSVLDLVFNRNNNNNNNRKIPFVSSDCKDCLVHIVNHCKYPIWLYDPNSSKLLSETPIQPQKVVGFYNNPDKNALPKKAIQVVAGNAIGASSGDCSSATHAGQCTLGWGNQGSLFEFTYDTSLTLAGNYDISLVNGFDFPLSVAPSTIHPAQNCESVTTGTLDVRNCANYLNYQENTSCNGPTSNNCTRQAIYPNDSTTLFSGGLLCHPVPTGEQKTGCRSPRTMALDYLFKYKDNTNTYHGTNPQCPGGAPITMPEIQAPELSGFTCVNDTPFYTTEQCLPPGTWPNFKHTSSSPLVTVTVPTPNIPNSVDNSWYKFIKYEGSNIRDVYAFPIDDYYSTQKGFPSVVKTCNENTQFSLHIGPINPGDPECPSNN